MTERELLDSDGENRAVRTFLQLYGGTNSPSIEGMRDHLAMSGFDGCWPEWAATQYGFLTKCGAQSWLRYLFSIESAAPKPTIELKIELKEYAALTDALEQVSARTKATKGMP